MTETKTNIFISFIKDFLPLALGADNPEAAGRTAELVFLAEQNGDPAFANDRFKTMRDRAKCLIPYITKGCPDRALDILELKMLQHRAIEHGEDHQDRINGLQSILMGKQLMQAEKDLIAADPRGFWNP